jgi:cell division septal protein FtsQ
MELIIWLLLVAVLVVVGMVAVAVLEDTELRLEQVVVEGQQNLHWY